MALPTIEVLCQQARQAIADRNWDRPARPTSRPSR